MQQWGAGPAETPQHSPKDRAPLSACRCCGPGLCGLELVGDLQHWVPAREPRTGLWQSEFVFQKHLALVNLPDPRASKRSRAPVPSPGSRDRHRSCPQMLSTQHVGAQGQQQAGPLPRRSRAGDAESPESKEADGSGWEERAPRLEQHLAVPRGEGCPGQQPGTQPQGARPSQHTQQKMDLALGCPGRRWVAQNRAPGEQRGFGPVAMANTGTAQGWVKRPASRSGAVSAAAPLGSPRWASGSRPTRDVRLWAQLWGRGLPVSPAAGQVLGAERGSREL